MRAWGDLGAIKAPVTLWHGLAGTRGSLLISPRTETTDCRSSCRRQPQDSGAYRPQAPASEPDPGLEMDMGPGAGSRQLLRGSTTRILRLRAAAATTVPARPTCLAETVGVLAEVAGETLLGRDGPAGRHLLGGGPPVTTSPLRCAGAAVACARKDQWHVPGRISRNSPWRSGSPTCRWG